MARIGRASNRVDRVALGACAALSLIALVLPTQVREPIASSLRRSVVAPMLMLQERAELSRRAFLAHDAVMSQRDSVALRAMNVVAVEQENARLRDLLGLGSRLKWGFVPAEALHGKGVRDEFGLTLSAGSLAGVQRLSPVVAPEGLVGVVDNVDPTMSHAMIWTHPDFRVSGMSEDASAFGIVQAHVASGPGRYLMELRGVPFRTSVKPGTMIVSSGLGGVYPRGIPLGRVIGEIKTSETWARTYLIRPSVFPADVSSVMILRPDRVTRGVDNVWAVGAVADSTVRQIVAAGDSMARTAALEEARARQAAQDSVVRDSLRRAGVSPDSVARATAPAVVPAPAAPVTGAPARPAPTTTTSATPRPAPVRRDTTGLGARRDSTTIRRDTTRRPPRRDSLGTPLTR